MRDAAAQTDTPGAAVTVARKTKANARPVAILADPRAWVLSGAHQRCTPKCQTEWNKVFMPPPSRRCAQASPADDGAAEGDERLVDVVADLPADAQAAKPVQQSDRSLRDPAVDAEAGAVFGAAPGDARNDLHARTRSR